MVYHEMLFLYSKLFAPKVQILAVNNKVSYFEQRAKYFQERWDAIP